MVIVTADATPVQIQRLRDRGCGRLSDQADRHPRAPPGGGVDGRGPTTRGPDPMTTPLTGLPQLLPRSSGGGRDRDGDGRPDLNRFLGLSAQIMCILDFDGRVVWWQRRIRADARLPLRRADRVHLDDLIHSDDARYAPGGDRAGRGGRGTGPPRSASGPGDGRWRWLEWTTRVDEARQRLYGVARDVTDRRLDEAALSDSEARLQAIMQFSPSAVFLKDLEGRYLLVNDEFSRATGVPVEQAMGSDARRAGPRTSMTWSVRDAIFLRYGYTFVTNERLHTVDGAARIHGQPLPAARRGRRPLRHGWIAADITDRRRRRAGPSRARDRLLDSVIKASPDMITLLDRSREDPSDQRGRERDLRPPPRGLRRYGTVRVRAPRRLRRLGVDVRPHGDGSGVAPAPALPGPPRRGPLGHRSTPGPGPCSTPKATSPGRWWCRATSATSSSPSSACRCPGTRPRRPARPRVTSCPA